MRCFLKIAAFSILATSAFAQDGSPQRQKLMECYQKWDVHKAAQNASRDQYQPFITKCMKAGVAQETAPGAEKKKRKKEEVSAPTEVRHVVANTAPPDAFVSLRTEPSTKTGQRVATMPNGTALRV